jgi:integrase
MPAERIKLTKTKVASAGPVKGKTAMIWDSEIRGFGLRVSAGGTKAFIMQRRIGKTERRITIGRVDDMTVDDARKEASKLVAQFIEGFDPVAEKQRETIRALTLAEAFANYIAAPVQRKGSRGKVRKPATVLDIKKQMRRFKDWLDLPISDITEDMVKTRHVELSEKSPAQANLAFRYLRAALNYAIADSDPKAPALSHNPVDRLNRTGAWGDVQAVQRFVPADRLAEFVEAVQVGLVGLQIDAEHRDAILFMLLTGARVGEVMGEKRAGYPPLAWSQVDLPNGTVFLPDPKNRRPFTIYLSKQVVEMLKARKHISGDNLHVFAKANGTVAEDMRAALGRIEALMGFRITCHDLRRTYVTAANSTRLTQYTLKALVNHATGGDVTGGYVQVTDTEVRHAAQNVADFILSPARRRPSDNVVTLEARA